MRHSVPLNVLLTAVIVGAGSFFPLIVTAGSVDKPHELSSVILDPIRQQAMAQKQPTIDPKTLDALISRATKDAELKVQPLVPLTGNASDASRQAAVSAEDPAFLERVDMMRKLFEIDGTDEMTRHSVNNVNMRLIILEVNNHIDINSLSESDKYRIATVATVVSSELSDKILNLAARQHALYLTREEVQQLNVDLNNAAQKKLTKLRLSDDGSVDRRAELDLQISALKIIQEFEYVPPAP